MARRTHSTDTASRSRPTPGLPAREPLVRTALLYCLLSSGFVAGVGGIGSATADAPGPSTGLPETGNATGEGAILSVYPNPARGGDTGEYVVLRLPTLGNWRLSDGETVVQLRNHTGGVVVTADPGIVGEQFPDATVVAAPVSLSNGGEALVLRHNGTRVHRVRYGNAPEGERYLSEHAEWRPRGFTPREAISTGPGNATGFLLPDSPDLPLDTLRGAEERILLAGYTFSSQRVAAVLSAAAKRGLTVRVLVDANPVGDVSRRQAEVLDSLVASGVEVRVVGVGTNRYAFHHPKYAVVDDRALVMTENWKPAGTGGRSSRGWGVRVESNRTADELSAVFAHDGDGPDTQNWASFRRGRTFERDQPANGSYPSEHSAERFHARNVTVLTAPGNAESRMVRYIEDAEERIDIVQPTLGRKGNSLVKATLRAAQRGVEVRILLSGAWYVAEENAALVSWLDDWAERNDAPLSVKVAEPGDRYEKVHAKGLLVDDDVAVVGSLNWNQHSAHENREVALALHGPEPVAFYREVFDADWRDGTDPTWLYLAGAGAAVVVAGLVAVRTMSFAEVGS